MTWQDSSFVVANENFSYSTYDEVQSYFRKFRFNRFSACFPEQTAYQQQVNLQTHSGSDLNAPALWRNGNKYLSGLPDRTPVHFSGKRPYPAHESAGYRPQPFLPLRKFRRRKQHRRNMCKSNTQAAALPEYSSPGKPFRNRHGSESKRNRGRHGRLCAAIKRL